MFIQKACPPETEPSLKRDPRLEPCAPSPRAASTEPRRVPSRHRPYLLTLHAIQGEVMTRLRGAAPVAIRPKASSCVAESGSSTRIDVVGTKYDSSAPTGIAQYESAIESR